MSQTMRYESKICSQFIRDGRLWASEPSHNYAAVKFDLGLELTQTIWNNSLCPLKQGGWTLFDLETAKTILVLSGRACWPREVQKVRQFFAKGHQAASKLKAGSKIGLKSLRKDLPPPKLGFCSTLPLIVMTAQRYFLWSKLKLVPIIETICQRTIPQSVCLWKNTQNSIVLYTLEVVLGGCNDYSRQYFLF